MDIRTKRAYEKPATSDGRRVLVDRLWPRGVRKQDARVQLWARELAPSSGLRKWYGHQPGRWTEFRRRYLSELADNPQALSRFYEGVHGASRVTLLFAARDEVRNNASVLADFLRERE